MRNNPLDCLRDTARSLLMAYGLRRIALLGEASGSALVDNDLHILVEFAGDMEPIRLTDWLSLQAELSRRCQCRVELVSVSRLEEHVAADTVALTVLYDARNDA